MATLIWQRRGRVAVALSALLAVFAVYTATRSNATSGGSAYEVPQVVDINPDPNIVEVNLTAEGAMVDLGGGVMASALTFNGQIPGPEFRLTVGQTVIVNFQNNAGHATGIHWHGIELNNKSDGTPLSQNMVLPGDDYIYKFIVPRPGVFWYHPHHHSSTNQVFKGMYGSFIVKDPYEDALVTAGKIPGPADTRTLALSDVTVCKAPGTNDAATYNPALPHVSGGALPAQAGPTPADLCDGSPIDEDGNPRGDFAAGEIPNIQKSGTSGRVNEGQTVLTNGRNVGGRAGTPAAPGALAAGAETLTVAAGQGLRLQIGNTATTRFFRLRLTTSTGTLVPLRRIGGQGGLLDHARNEGGVEAGGFDWGFGAGEILLDPGDRADVVAAIPAAAAGVLTMWTQDIQRTGAGFANIPTVPVAHFNVVGSVPAFTIPVGTTLRASLPGAAQETLGPATDVLLNRSPGMTDPDIELNAPGGPLQINGIQGVHDFAGDYTAAPRPDSTRWSRLNKIIELSTTNTSGARHPFHLHGFSLQPKSLTKAASPTYNWPYQEFRDNIDVPPGYTLTYRIRTDDRPLVDGVTGGGGYGRWVFHCHIFFHAVFGMISEYDVTNGFLLPHFDFRAYHKFIHPRDPVIDIFGTFFDQNRLGIRSIVATLGKIQFAGGGPIIGGDQTPNAPGDVQLADGQVRWTYEATGGEHGLVYFTITDNAGMQNQTLFSITSAPGFFAPTGKLAGNGKVLDEGKRVAFYLKAEEDPDEPDTGYLLFSVCNHNASGVCVGSPKWFSATSFDDVGFTDNINAGPATPNTPETATYAGEGTFDNQPGFTYWVTASDNTATGPDRFHVIVKGPNGDTVFDLGNALSSGNLTATPGNQ